MRRPLAWIVAVLGVAAVVRFLTRKRVILAPPSAQPAADTRAEELRAKLAESRAIADERDEFEAAETTVDRAEPVGDPQTRRHEVHEAGRDAIDRMRASGGE